MWNMDLTSSRLATLCYHKAQDELIPSNFRRYYKTQDELITAFEELQLEVDDAMETAEEQVAIQRHAARLAKASFFCNLVSIVIHCLV